MATQPHSEVPQIHHLSLKPVSLSAGELLQIAIQHHANIDVIERVTALCAEERGYQAKVAFDDSLSRCQAQLSRISADGHNPQTNSRYATYAQLDRVVRPIYTAEELSISFGEKDCPIPGKTRFVAYVSRGGYTREYIKDMTASPKGPKGNDVMTQTHAEAALDSYAKRYLLKDIFNIAVGEDDDDGNLGGSGAIPQNRVEQLCARISSARDLNELTDLWTRCANEVMRAQDRNALNQLRAVKDARKKDLQ